MDNNMDGPPDTDRVPSWHDAALSNIMEVFDDCGWPDAECFALSCRLHDIADLDFNGLVDLDEATRIRNALGAACGKPGKSYAGEAEKKQLIGLSLAEAWMELIKGYCDEVGPETFKEAARAVLNQQPHSGPRIIVGPVIGKVTDTTARILVEVNSDVRLTCTLTPAEPNDSNGPRTLELSLRKHRPGVFVFKGLAPRMRYRADFEGAELLVDKCSFCTIPPGGWRLDAGMKPTFAVASCNEVHISRTLPPGSEADLWRDLQIRLQNGLKLDYLLQLGDNVYNDSEWYLIEKGKKTLEGTMCKWGITHTWLKGMNRSDWDKRRDEIAEVFRAAYRETWGHPPTRWVLANVPNLMIFDDHDIRDDWGDRPEDLDKTSIDYYLAEVAYGVILEYQRQLYEDVLPEQKPTFDYHFHTFGDVGLVFVDVRACKTFHHIDQDHAAPMLGIKQWRALEDACAGGGEFANCRALLVLVPEPVAYVSNTPTMIAGQKMVDDLLGQWSATKHQAEVPRFLNMLTFWRHADPGRDLIIIGGDVHEGGWTDLTCTESPHPLSDKEPEHYRIRQLTTSAIAQKMTQSHEAAAVVMTRDIASAADGYKLGGGWTNRHYDWTNRRNYALVDVFLATGGTFQVRVLSGHGLKNADGGMLSKAFGGGLSGGVSDPYVTVTCGSSTKKTKVIKDCLDPVWDSEEYTFEVAPDEVHVKFKVYDKNNTSDTLIGEAKISIYSFSGDAPETQKLALGEGCGFIQVEGVFKPKVGHAKLCQNGCNRDAFRQHPTCCTRCKGPDGPHAQDCEQKGREIRRASTLELQKNNCSVVLGGQLIASDGVNVQVRKRRTTKDPAFTYMKGLQGISKELGEHVKGVVFGRKSVAK